MEWGKAPTTRRTAAAETLFREPNSLRRAVVAGRLANVQRQAEVAQAAYVGPARRVLTENQNARDEAVGCDSVNRSSAWIFLQEYAQNFGETPN